MNLFYVMQCTLLTTGVGALMALMLVARRGRMPYDDAMRGIFIIALIVRVRLDEPLTAQEQGVTAIEPISSAADGLRTCKLRAEGMYRSHRRQLRNTVTHRGTEWAGNEHSAP